MLADSEKNFYCQLKENHELFYSWLDNEVKKFNEIIQTDEPVESSVNCDVRFSVDEEEKKDAAACADNSENEQLKTLPEIQDEIIKKFIDSLSGEAELSNLLTEKSGRIQKLFENENFILMCKEIDCLEKYGKDKMVDGFFTVGTNKAKKECKRLVCDLKTLVFDLVFDKNNHNSNVNVIEHKLLASFENMQHRNVFSLMAKSILHIFECMWSCFSGGRRPDFFRTERKVIGESLIAHSGRYYKQLQGISPPGVSSVATVR